MAASLKRANHLPAVIGIRFYKINKKQTITKPERHVPTTKEGIWHFFTDDPQLPPPKPRGNKLVEEKSIQDQAVTKPVLKPIVIPTKIERSPTAILEALAATVRPDRNQPHHHGIDDPYTISYTTSGKIQDMAAKESGRKAAHLMLQTYPDNFTRLWEDPFPKDLAHHPYEGYQHTEPSEAALLERISKRKVTDAVEMYGSCKGQGLSLSQAGLEQLLELLTVYNCQDHDTPSTLANIVEPRLSNFAPFPPSTWQSGNAAERVFEELPEKTPTAYCLLLRGKANNFDKEGAFALYNEMKAAGIPVDVYTYNKLLLVASLDLPSVDEISNTIESVFRDMNANGVAPNVGTFNAAIQNMRRVSRWKGAKQYIFTLLSEMKACGLDPKLSTLYEAMCVFYYVPADSSRMPDLPRTFLDNVLDHIKGQEFEVTSEADTLFFRLTMQVISSMYKDSKLALQLHDVVKLGNNARALGNRRVAWKYYAELFNVIITLEHTDVVMDLYNSICPHVYYMMDDQYVALVENIDLHDTYHYIPQLLSDILTGTYTAREKLFETYTGAMASKQHNPQLQQQFSELTSIILRNWEMSKDRNRPNPINGAMISNAMLVFYNNGEPDKAREAYEVYQNNRQIKGKISVEALVRHTDQLISEGDNQVAKDLLVKIFNLDSQYVPVLVDKFLQSPSLSEEERDFVKGLAKEAETDSSSSDSDVEEKSSKSRGKR